MKNILFILLHLMGFPVTFIWASLPHFKYCPFPCDTVFNFPIVTHFSPPPLQLLLNFFLNYSTVFTRLCKMAFSEQLLDYL